MLFRLVPLAAGVLLAAFAAPALAQSGGAAAPDSGGGHAFEQPAPKRVKSASPRLRATIFTVTPGTVELGKPLRFAWRVDGRVRARHRARRARARGRRAARSRSRSAPAARAAAPCARGRRSWPPGATARGCTRPDRAARSCAARRAPPGRLTLEVTAPAPPPASAAGAARRPAAVFPVQGAYSLGGDDARFGAGRTGHTHQGQDIIAAEGTPVVTPVAGIVHWRAYQAAGAGHYVVIRGDDGRDYAFMHFQAGSTVVAKGQRVAAGQRLASVGNTGDSHGAHLHFEIWPDGWYATADSHPIDPLPDLLAWAGAS